MSFRIAGLDPAPFRHLFALDDEALAAQGARSYVVDRSPGYPDRIAVRDAQPGERVVLLNYTHLDGHTPYRQSHAIFVAEDSLAAFDAVDQVPPALRIRQISLRAYDTAHMMVEADVLPGRELETGIARLFENPRVAYLHAHYAKPGCYAARIDRA